MEILTLKPHANEIIVNQGTTDGAIDIFSYTPDESATRAFGSLYVLGHRDTDSSNVGYVVSLISALARREYYANPNLAPREAFSRTLHKANEVVDEFFRNGAVKLSVGIVAIAGGTLMVSKLDKFRILLARENEVIDILSNVMLFTKEHSEKRRFSSIIHGSVQPGDRVLAYIPTRAITSRERNLKSWFLKLPQEEFAARIDRIASEHSTFAATMLHIDMAQTAEPALIPSPQPPELIEESSAPEPSLAAARPAPERETLAWKPRQLSSTPAMPSASISETSATLAGRADEPLKLHPTVTLDTEVPQIIPSEFSLGTRRTLLSRFTGRVRFIRLDRRGKAIALALVAVLTIGGTLAAKSLLFVSPQDQKNKLVLAGISRDIEEARSKITQNERVQARDILTRTRATLQNLHLSDDEAGGLEASITTAMDAVDNAQPSVPTLIASPQPDALSVNLAAWSSASHTVWVGGTNEDGTLWSAPLSDNGIGTHIALGSAKADLLIGWSDSVLAVNFSNRSVTRTVGGTVTSYIIPTQDAVLDAAEFGDSLYVLTDTSILKISDLDTKKPVTKQWLATTAELVSGAARIWVDGSVTTLSRDGTLATYYKGKKTTEVTAPLSPAGTWRMVGSSDGLLAVANGVERRIYLINPQDGSLVRTLKIDSDLPFTYLSAGPDNSVLLITKEGKVWKAK